MLLTRIYLRNFRVYEDELDLEVPPGLVGIYGPNGSGKSTLLEAILFTLWGKSRTTKEQIRSSGVGGDCVTEVEFEHEGHLYLARRVLKGINSTVSVEVRCDGMVMSTGTRDAERYIESVLGMDDSAFRASVFAEQKQLAAFSDQSPAERRKLVLQLLGVTPLDAARDAARRDAKQLTTDHQRLRDMLPDLAALGTELDDANARADAARVRAEAEQAAAAATQERLEAATAVTVELDQRRQEHEALVQDGKAAREQHDTLASAVAEQREELARLDTAGEQLVACEAEATGLAEAERELELLTAVAGAARALAAVKLPPEPPAPDPGALEALRVEAAEARESSARAAALLESAVAEAGRARDAAKRSDGLSGESDCPVCGQALGDAFETVRAHRQADLRAAETRSAELSTRADAAARAAEEAQRLLAERTRALESAEAARRSWEQASQRHADAATAVRRAWSELREFSAGRGAEPPPDGGLAEELDSLRRKVEGMRKAARTADQLRGRLEGRPGLERSLAANVERLEAADARVTALREKVRVLAFDRAGLEAAEAKRADAASAAARSSAAANQAALDAARDQERAVAAAARLSGAREQHDKLGELESGARHAGRVADLLSEFRNTVVASVGPRLSVHAAELFAELTDHEYDELMVDPETYQLQISDAGRVFGLDRFSGSEIDLANLALRVAISEHIHFQSGGSVGLLVLDEVFGPLDEDRKNRMLLALERLRGRFRQVLVVTHDSEIKEQMPNAIEVVKLPGRRATARIATA